MSATLVAIVVTGCFTGSSSSDQVVTGRVESSTFPEPVTGIRAIGASSTIEAAIAADGTFSLALPSDDRYRIELVSAVRGSTLVFPRTGGAIDTTFYVASRRTLLDVGTVRYLRDPQSKSYEFDGAGCAGGTNTEGDVCVEDGGGDVGGGGGGDEGGGGGGQDTGGGGGGDEGGGGGQDTGGGGGQDTGGGGEGDPCGGEVSHPDAGSTSGDAAIGDRNLPEAIGCGGGDEGGGGGQDPGTPGEEG